MKQIPEVTLESSKCAEYYIVIMFSGPHHFSIFQELDLDASYLLQRTHINK